MTIPLQFASLLARTSSLVTWSLYEMRSYLLTNHLFVDTELRIRRARILIPVLVLQLRHNSPLSLWFQSAQWAQCSVLRVRRKPDFPCARGENTREPKDSTATRGGKGGGNETPRPGKIPSKFHHR